MLRVVRSSGHECLRHSAECGCGPSDLRISGLMRSTLVKRPEKA